LQYHERLDAIKVSFVEANGHISPACETRAKDTVVTVYDDR
jgi:predicted molibdopterin-dependent oxidoreductase YjgC